MKKRNEAKTPWREGINYQEKIVFSWLDRIRILFGCEVGVTATIKTQWAVGEIVDASMTLSIEKLLSKLTSSGVDPVETTDTLHVA